MELLLFFKSLFPYLRLFLTDFDLRHHFGKLCQFAQLAKSACKDSTISQDGGEIQYGCFFVFSVNRSVCFRFRLINTFWQCFAIAFQPKLSKKCFCQDGANF
jgi:hypothetical protein